MGISSMKCTCSDRMTGCPTLNCLRNAHRIRCLSKIISFTLSYRYKWGKIIGQRKWRKLSGWEHIYNDWGISTVRVAWWGVWSYLLETFKIWDFLWFTIFYFGGLKSQNSYISCVYFCILILLTTVLFLEGLRYKCGSRIMMTHLWNAQTNVLTGASQLTGKMWG